MRPAKTRLSLLLTGFGVVAGLLASHSAQAVGSRTFTLDTLDKLAGGDLKGVAIGSDGVVRAGWMLGNVPLPDANASFAALALADGSVLVGTSPGGRVMKVTGDQATLFADTKELAVTSLIQDAKGTIYAGTLPNGKIYKISQGKADVFATLPGVEHVWALAFDKTKSAFYASTGPEGKVFRVEAGGQATEYFKSEEPHLVSLAVAENGDVYTGSSGKGILYKITAVGRGAVVYDFPGEEVKAIALGPRGYVYAIANEYGEPPEPPRRNANSGRAPAGPSSASRQRPGKGTLTRFDAQGRPERMMNHTEFHYLSLVVDANGLPHVGTGAEGRIYTVDDAHAVTLVADTDERQIGAIVLANGKPFVAASDPAVFHRVVAQGGADAVWTSKVLDAGLRAKFGHVAWQGAGAVEVSTRSGNTATPDATWSAWSNPVTSGGAVTSPAGRYVQMRARWKDPKATLNAINLPFITDNVRPVVTEVTAQQKGVNRDSKEGIVASGGEAPKHDSVVKVSWKVDNADSDPLRYRLAFRREGQAIWREMMRTEEVFTKSEFDWDTLALPEGRYRVRVEASDEIANPPDLVQKHALESGVVLVDNTAPVLSNVGMTGRKLRFTAKDGLGPITRAEVTFDGRLEWRPLAPIDGIFDTAEETIEADLSALLTPGSHIVAIRVYDAAGNAAVHEVEAP